MTLATCVKPNNLLEHKNELVVLFIYGGGQRLMGYLDCMRRQRATSCLDKYLILEYDGDAVLKLLLSTEGFV